LEAFTVSSPGTSLLSMTPSTLLESTTMDEEEATTLNGDEDDESENNNNNDEDDLNRRRNKEEALSEKMYENSQSSTLMDTIVVIETDHHITTVNEKKLFNVDFQVELMQRAQCGAVAMQEEDSWMRTQDAIQLMTYKMAKRFVLEKIDFDVSSGYFHLSVKTISGIVDCITPKTEKLVAVFSELFDPFKNRSLTVPLQYRMSDSGPVLRGPLRPLCESFQPGKLKITVEQWIEQERNTTCDTIEILLPQFTNELSMVELVNLTPFSAYVQFMREATVENFEQLALHHLRNNVCDFGGFTILTHFACRNDTETTIKLLRLGFDLYQPDRMGYNTMYWCHQFAAFDVMRLFAELGQFDSRPSFLLKIQVDDPSRLQLDEYSWRHFYLSNYNSVCVIKCKHIVQHRQELRVRMGSAYDGVVNILPDNKEFDKFNLRFSSSNYRGTLTLQLFDRLLGKVIAESDIITVFDTSSIHTLMCNDHQARRVGSQKQSNIQKYFLNRLGSKGS